MIEEYLGIKNEREGSIFISNLLHEIKYAEDEKRILKKYGEADLSGLEKLSGREFEKLCVIATFVEQAFNSRGLSGPGWTRDGRLFLSKPRISKSSSAAAVLHATQACLNHNVFLSRSDFEVY